MPDAEVKSIGPKVIKLSGVKAAPFHDLEEAIMPAVVNGSYVPHPEVVSHSFPSPSKSSVVNPAGNAGYKFHDVNFATCGPANRCNVVS